MPDPSKDAAEVAEINLQLARLAKDKDRLRRMLGDDPGRSPPSWLQKDIAALVEREASLRRRLASLPSAGPGDSRLRTVPNLDIQADA